MIILFIEQISINRMISEGSRDTEDWSMKIAENSGIHVYSHKQLFKIVIIFHSILFLPCFWFKITR